MVHYALRDLFHTDFFFFLRRSGFKYKVSVDILWGLHSGFEVACSELHVWQPQWQLLTKTFSYAHMVNVNVLSEGVEQKQLFGSNRIGVWC